MHDNLTSRLLTISIVPLTATLKTFLFKKAETVVNMGLISLNSPVVGISPEFMQLQVTFDRFFWSLCTYSKHVITLLSKKTISFLSIQAWSSYFKGKLLAQFSFNSACFFSGLDLFLSDLGGIIQNNDKEWIVWLSNLWNNWVIKKAMKSKAKISVQNKIFQFDIACIEVYVNTPFFHSLCQVSLGPMHTLWVRHTRQKGYVTMEKVCIPFFS